MLFISLVILFTLSRLTGCRAASATAVPVMGGAVRNDPRCVYMAETVVALFDEVLLVNHPGMTSMLRPMIAYSEEVT